MRNQDPGFWLTMLAIGVLTVIFVVALYSAPTQIPPTSGTLKHNVTKGDVFLGWMKYAAHVQIRFLNGGHTTYGQEQMKDITKELEAGLKCVQEKE